VLSLTHSQYHVDPETAFHVYTGMLVPMDPDGDISTAFPGLAGVGTVKAMPRLQGPAPLRFNV
jgi:hypothetical protein